MLGIPVLRITRGALEIALRDNPPLEKGDLLPLGADVARLVDDASQLAREVADKTARQFVVDQAEIVMVYGYVAMLLS